MWLCMKHLQSSSKYRVQAKGFEFPLCFMVFSWISDSLVECSEDFSPQDGLMDAWIWDVCKQESTHTKCLLLRDPFQKTFHRFTQNLQSRFLKMYKYLYTLR